MRSLVVVNALAFVSFMGPAVSYSLQGSAKLVLPKPHGQLREEAPTVAEAFSAPYVGNLTKIVIAHRGAPAYLPEHTLAGKVLAMMMGADYLEQDLVMTKDNHLIVLHDTNLEGMTNVDEVFKGRSRPDGTYCALDFTLDEVQQLKVTERFTRDASGKMVQAYPNRFPIMKSDFRINTFQQEIELIQGLDKTLGRTATGIYPEIKKPFLHRQEGKDISKAVLEVLKEYGYDDFDSKCFLQCFDPNELKRIQYELFPAMNMKLKTVQLLSETSWNETLYLDKDGNVQNYNYDWMFEADGMKKISEYADAIGPWYPMLVDDASTKELVKSSGMVENAHKNGLAVHPYTFRADEPLPSYVSSFEQMLQTFYFQIGLDGLFSDFPDKAVAAIKNYNVTMPAS